MHLKSVTLTNFRCFDSLTVDLHPRLTVFVAENAGGKTTILDGIAVGLTPILTQFSSANQRLSGPGIKDTTDFRILPTQGRIELKAPFTQIAMLSTTGLRWDNWKASEKGAQPPEKIGQALLTPLSDITKSYATEVIQTLPVFAYYGAQRGLIEIPTRLRENVTQEVNYNYPTSGLFGALDAQSDFKEMLKWFDAEESSELRKQKESPDELVKSVALAAVRRAITTVLGGKYHAPHFDSKHKFCVLADEEPKKLQVSQLSQGYKSMLALVMDFARRLALANEHLAEADQGADVRAAALTYYRRWNDTDDFDDLDLLDSGPALAPAIMLIDEVDLHLHPSWQQRVLGDLMRAFPGTQFIVTTHSPQVLTTVRKENIRRLAREVTAENPEGQWVARMPDHSPLAQESADALAHIMGTYPRPPLPLIADLHAYEQLARAGLAETEEARAILARLTTAGFEFNQADLSLFTFLAAQKAKKEGEHRG